MKESSAVRIERGEEGKKGKVSEEGILREGRGGRGEERGGYKG